MKIFIKMLIGLGLALLIASLFLPLSAGAYGNTGAASYFQKTVKASRGDVMNSAATRNLASTSGPTFQVSAGFHTRYRDNNWIPVQITLYNNGPDFSGTISIAGAPLQSQFSRPGNIASTLDYQIPITLPNSAQKLVSFYVPMYVGGQSITVKLLDSNGTMIRSQTSTLNPLTSGDIFVGILSDQTTGFNSLTGISLPGQNGSVITEFLDAKTMPAMADILKNFNLIILDDFTSSTLRHEQLTALQTWVNQGGALILVGGPEWRRSFSALPGGLLPVLGNGTRLLPSGTTLLPIGGPTVGKDGGNAGGAPASVLVSTGVINSTGSYNDEVLLASGTTPLIVQAQRDQGNVYYLAYDPTLQPLAGWAGNSALWKSLLFRALGDTSLAPLFGPGRTSGSQASMEGLLQNLLPNVLPSPWLLFGLLVGYLLVLGPVRFLVIRLGPWRTRRHWSWRIVLASIVVFTLLAYGLALEEKGTAILSNSISVVQLDQDGTSAHVTSYVGVFVPNQGNFQVHLPGEGLVQPSSNSFYSGSLGGPNATSQGTTVTSTESGTDVNLLGVNMWTLRSLVSQQDRPMHGGIDSHLTLQNGRLTGTVSNTLSYGLSDVYVLLPNNYASIGHLGAGQTSSVNLQLKSAPTNSMAGTNLAGQIAASTGMSPYFGYNGQQPQNEQQRHLLILSALSGTYYGSSYCYAGPCSLSIPAIVRSPRGVILSRGIAISNSPYTSLAPLSSGPLPYTTPGYDPLLLGGTSPTLIGWADTNNTDLTVNGLTPGGTSESLIQAPLSLQYAGTLTLPASLAGQIVDIEGNNVQSPTPGVYTFSTGSMTFEFSVPINSRTHISSLTLTEPANLSTSTGLGSVTDISGNARLYNWHTHSWDSISFIEQTFTTDDASSYVDPNGRVLVQFSNSDSTIGTVVFGKPFLDVKGVASNS